MPKVFLVGIFYNFFCLRFNLLNQIVLQDQQLIGYREHVGSIVLLQSQVSMRGCHNFFSPFCLVQLEKQVYLFFLSRSASLSPCPLRIREAFFWLQLQHEPAIACFVTLLLTFLFLVFPEGHSQVSQWLGHLLRLLSPRPMPFL